MGKVSQSPRGSTQSERCRWRRSWSLGALAVALLLEPASALAQSEADRATARALAAEGYQALTASDYATAEERFRRADALVHAPTLVVDQARALVGLGRLVAAQERLEFVLREGVPSDAPFPFKRAMEDAARLVEDIKPRIAWLTIVVKGPSAPLVAVDGKAVPLAALGVRRATDPGTRIVRVTAEGYVTQELTAKLAEGGEQNLEVELQPDDSQPPAAVPLAAAKPPDKQREVKAAPISGRTRQTLGIVALGVGGVGMVAGSVTGVLALKKRSSLKDQCPDNHCSADLKDDVDRYHLMGTLSGVSFGLGVVGLATGATLLWLVGDSSEQPKTSKPSLEPSIGFGSIGLRAMF